MKVRESGMPEQVVWERFFDVEDILIKLGLQENCCTVLDFGCGYGTFTHVAARMISGKVIALDIDENMLDWAERYTQQHHIDNIEFSHIDFITDGSGLAGNSVDFAMLFNILHLENPIALLQEAYRNLSLGGKLSVIHWNVDPDTPRGPPLHMRPSPEQCILWATSIGFTLVNNEIIDLAPYHFGLVFEK